MGYYKCTCCSCDVAVINCNTQYPRDELCDWCVSREYWAQRAEIAALKAEVERLRESECGKCGRSLAPDGDCHGCRADRLEAEVKYRSVEHSADSAKIRDLKAEIKNMRIRPYMDGRLKAEFAEQAKEMERLKADLAHANAGSAVFEEKYIEQRSEVERLRAAEISLEADVEHLR